jgi:hypothetical protein
MGFDLTSFFTNFQAFFENLWNAILEVIRNLFGL